VGRGIAVTFSLFTEYRSNLADFDAFGLLDPNLNSNDFDPVLGRNTKPRV
jgi:hypothetical protein